MIKRNPDALIQGWYCPLPNDKQMKHRLKLGIYKITGIGLVQRCAGCKEYWPADTEFFFSSLHGRMNSWCRACYMEWRYPDGTTKAEREAA